MARQPDPKKADEWTKRLERYAKSRCTVATFCREEGVSVPSFYHWKRKLGVSASAGAGGRTPRPTRNHSPGAFQPVRVVLPERLAGVTVRLGAAIAVDLGSDAAVLERVVKQLWDLHRAGAEPSC